MDEAELLARVKAESLERAWAHFPEDVRSAAELAARQGRSLQDGTLTPADEPWPRMRPGTPA